jgi:hypothetical protein
MDYLLCETDKLSLDLYAAPRARFAPIYKKRGIMGGGEALIAKEGLRGKGAGVGREIII